MKKHPIIGTLLWISLLCCTGCGDASTMKQDSSADTEYIGAVTTHARPTASDAMPNTTEPATLPLESHDNTIAATTESDVTTTLQTETTSMTSLTIGEAEQHGDDPYPTYFTYRFSPSAIGVRLSGGNYQVLNCDLSNSIEEGLETSYRLEDCNFDGHPDLLVPTRFGNANTAYALFIWNPDTKCFDENSYTLVNPVLRPMKHHILCRTRTNAAMETLAIYTWQNGTIQPVMQYVADYSTYTLTTVDPSANEQPPQTASYTSVAALEAALNALAQ